MLFGSTEIGQVTSEFLPVSTSIVLRCWMFLYPTKKHLAKVFLSSPLWLNWSQCALGFHVLEAFRECWGRSCWGERRSSFHICSVALYAFHGGDFFFNVVFSLNILTLKNVAIYLFILSIFLPLFCSPFRIIGSKINAVLLYMYFRSMYYHIYSLSCATGYTRFNILIFLFS